MITITGGAARRTNLGVMQLNLRGWPCQLGQFEWHASNRLKKLGHRYMRHYDHTPTTTHTTAAEVGGQRMVMERRVMMIIEMMQVETSPGMKATIP